MRIKLNTKLFLLYLAIGIVSVELIGLYTFYNLKKAKFDFTYTVFTEQLRQLDFTIKGFLSEVKNDVLTFSDNPEINTRNDRNFTSLLNADGNTFLYNIGTAEQQIIDLFNVYIENHPYVNSVYMGRANGAFIRAQPVDRPKLYDPRNSEWYRLAVLNPQDVIYTKSHDQSTTENKSIGVVKALLDDSGNVYGAIGIDITLKDLTDLISQIEIGEYGYAFLMDNKGMMLSGDNSEDLLTGYDMNGKQYLEKVMENDNGYMIFDYDNEFYYLFFDTTSIGWKICGVIPLEEINAGVYKFLKEIIFILALSTLLSGLLIIIAINNIVINPINKLYDGTKNIIDTGNLKQKISIGSKDEIEDLAKSFNKMVDNLAFREKELKELNEELEQRVHKRTNELQNTNSELKKTLKELKSMQKQIITQEKLASLGALTAGIAHEIKNPLNFVNNFSDIGVELVEEIKKDLEVYKKKKDSEHLGYIESNIADLKINLIKINDHGTRADNIIKAMLLHSRGERGKRDIVGINSLLEEYVNLAYHGMRAADSSFNVTIERDYKENIEKISVVPQDISRVFLNILTNACYAVNEKSKLMDSDDYSPMIYVATRDNNGDVEIRIKDNGNGIPKKISDKIFNPFFSTKPTGSGTGLGLSISYDIVVNEHRGTIDFVTQEGEYTEFIIKIPKK